MITVNHILTPLPTHTHTHTHTRTHGGLFFRNPEKGGFIRRRGFIAEGGFINLKVSYKFLILQSGILYK